MGKLLFKDINEWTPASISIVDEPDHPLAHFEVYEDDEEFVKKSLNLKVNNMVNNNEEKIENDETVSMPQSLFEKLLGGRFVGKSIDPANEPPAKPPEKNDGETGMDKVLTKLEAMDKKIDNIDERVTKIEGGKQDDGDGDDGKGNESDPVPGAVAKNVQTKPQNNEDNNDGDEGEGTVDDTNVVIKSREVDPDASFTKGTSEKTFYERIGRDSGGMTW